MFVVAALPLGAALALCALYVTLPVFLAQDDPYYRPERPEPLTFLRLAPAPLAAGLVAAAGSTLILNELAGALPVMLRYILSGLLFGASVQYVTGALMPINRFFLNVAEGQAPGILSDRVVEAVYGTPLFAFSFGTRAIGIGVLFGLVHGLGTSISWLPKAMSVGPGAVINPIMTSGFVAAALLLALLAGPPALFRSLVAVFDGR